MLKQETGLVIEGILYLYRKSDGFLTIKVTNVRRQIHHFLQKGQVGKLPFLNVQMKAPLCPDKNICSTRKLMKTAYLR